MDCINCRSFMVIYEGIINETPEHIADLSRNLIGSVQNVGCEVTDENLRDYTYLFFDMGRDVKLDKNIISKFCKNEPVYALPISCENSWIEMLTKMGYEAEASREMWKSSTLTV